MHPDFAELSEEHACCHAHHGHGQSPSQPSPAKKYFCPMCDGVESESPGSCPKCGMALERNPAYVEAQRSGYTCPMHPEIHQDHPGSCPICGMALEPVAATAKDDDNAELNDMSRR
jgi:Cu+-exporting ATPase